MPACPRRSKFLRVRQVATRSNRRGFAGASVTDDGNGNVRTGITNLTYTFDALNQLRQATGSSNVVVDYDPAGMLRRVNAGGVVTDYLYDGPDLVLQPDPIGYGAGMNLYGYVRGDPINSVDPSGLNDQCVSWSFQIPQTWTSPFVSDDVMREVTVGYQVMPAVTCLPAFYEIQPTQDGTGGGGVEAPQGILSEFFTSCPKPAPKPAGRPHYPGQFNPTKLMTAMLSAANGGRLAASGTIKLIGGTALDFTGAGAVPGTAAIVLGALNLRGAVSAFDKSLLLAREAYKREWIRRLPPQLCGPFAVRTILRRPGRTRTA